jgi:hypothetical protein
MDINELPVATDGGQGRAATVPIETARASRRDLISYTVRGATLLGLTGLSLFRAPRRAGAENPPWNELGNCGPHDPGSHSPCYDNMCVGTSLDLMDNGYCTNVCEHVDGNNWFQWHKNKTYGPFVHEGQTYWLHYQDYPGEICAGPYDAWWWNVGGCWPCTEAIFRCHDGQKRVNEGAWAFTICEGLARCNGTEPTC